MHCSLRRGRPLLLVLSVVAGLALVPAGPAGAAGTTVRVSVASGGAQGKTDREIKRCLKRYIARELYRRLENPPSALDAA